MSTDDEKDYRRSDLRSMVKIGLQRINLKIANATSRRRARMGSSNRSCRTHGGCRAALYRYARTVRET